MITVKYNANTEFPTHDKDGSQGSIKESTQNDEPTLRGSTQLDHITTVRGSNQDMTARETTEPEEKRGRVSIYSS